MKTAAKMFFSKCRQACGEKRERRALICRVLTSPSVEGAVLRAGPAERLAVICLPGLQTAALQLA